MPTERMQAGESTGALLTADEVVVLNKIAAAFNAFLALPRCHPSEVEEARLHVHSLQLLLMARAAMRAYPGLFTSVEGFQ